MSPYFEAEMQNLVSITVLNNAMEEAILRDAQPFYEIVCVTRYITPFQFKGE